MGLMNKIINMENEDTSFIKHARELRKLESEKHILETRPKPESAVPILPSKGGEIEQKETKKSKPQQETEPRIEEKKKLSIGSFPLKNRRFIRKKTYRRY